MAFTQTELTALESAIAKGVTTVAYANRTITYRSLDEMLRIRTLMQADIATGDRTAAGGLRVHPEYSKGC